MFLPTTMTGPPPCCLPQGLHHSRSTPGINAKFDKLNVFIDYINDHIPISVICIQESWGHEGIDMSTFSLPNYKMVNQNRRLSTHGGLIVCSRVFFLQRTKC